MDCPPCALELTFSRHWAAVCGDKEAAMSYMSFGVGAWMKQLPSKPGHPGCLMAGLSVGRHPTTTTHT